MILRDHSGFGAAVFASLGGGVVAVAALLLTSFQSEPTLIDRAFPLVVISIWILAVRTRPSSWYELALLLLPLSFVVELAIPNTELRMLLLGATLALAAVIHVTQLREQWEPAEMLTAVAILAPLRLVEPSWESLSIQLLLIVGAVLLWRELRRSGAGTVLSAAAVILMVVSLPAGPFRFALVPWVVAILVVSLRRALWLPGVAAIVLGVLAARWLGAAAAVIVVAVWAAGRVNVSRSPAFVPTLQATVGNVPATVASLPFFPPLFFSSRSFAAVGATVVLAFFVRPSLSGAIVSIGIVAACALRGENAIAADERRVVSILPPLVLIGIILLFFPWSGTLTARPPAPVPLFALLSIAAVALLPSIFRAWTGVAAAALFVALLMATETIPEQRREIGRSLTAGEHLVIPLEATLEDVELHMAGANLADAARGHPFATVEILDERGRGYSRSVEIGEVADWAAFHPDHVLATLNPRPDDPARVEGYGAAAWVRGTGRIRLTSLSAPRSLVVTASPLLDEGEKVIVEEIRFR